MKNTNTFSVIKILIITIFAFVSKKTNAQNCTVNAGVDASYCYNQLTNSVNDLQTLFTLTGNSSGNVNTTPNLLWEIVSAPVGANISLMTANNNTTITKAKFSDVPTGIYIFRIGIDCLNGGRIYDSVNINVVNVADFQLFADKKLSDICANTQDSIHLVGRPLKTGEVLLLKFYNVLVKYNNTTISSYFQIVGPTSDSVRLTATNIRYNISCLRERNDPYFRVELKNGTCSNSGYPPFINDVETWGVISPYIVKNAVRNVDTLTCATNTKMYISNYNVCDIGGLPDNYYANNTIIKTISGSGTLKFGDNSSGEFDLFLTNNWDTVATNTLNMYEITYTGNNCFATFKDTVKLFLKSSAPGTTGYSFVNGFYFNYKYFCVRQPFPLTSYTFPLVTSGIGNIPSRYKFTITGYKEQNYSSAIFLNPNRKDSLTLVGPLDPGSYSCIVRITDTTNGCFFDYALRFALRKPIQLPTLRDTTICGYSNTIILSIANGVYQNEYTSNLVIGNGNTAMYYGDLYLRLNNPIDYNYGYDIAVVPVPILNNPNACTDGRSDTFHISMLSSGHPSNAGTDQTLLCNVATTNLAGSLPSSTGGIAGFWKFLPAISTNAGNPIVIVDSANKNTEVSGFSNLSTYYFSWNVNDGNGGNFCNLQPDTVMIVFSGISPTTTQKAQPDFTGILSNDKQYMLTSNAVVPTFNVQWNYISGPAGSIIVSPNAQNTNITGLTTGTYLFEIIVSNTCGIFKDTVVLNFTGILPVTLISFNGIKNINGNDDLSWNVADEINMKQYELELSADAISFKNINTSIANNNGLFTNTYSYKNSKTSNEVNFYRLKMVNLDNSFVYSNVLKLDNKQSNLNSFTIAPNPAKINFSINVSSLETQFSKIEILNVLGQLVYTRSIKILKGVNNYPIDFGLFPKGLYFAKLNNVSKKFIIE